MKTNIKINVFIIIDLLVIFPVNLLGHKMSEFDPHVVLRCFVQNPNRFQLTDTEQRDKQQFSVFDS